MLSSSPVAAACGGPTSRASIDPERLERRLRRFSRAGRQAVTALAHRDARLADLAFSFPALLFALAVPRPSFDPKPVITAVLAGAPLKQLAHLAGLPLWSRKLMPEAFEQPLAALPGGLVAARQIVNHLPSSPKLAARWLRDVAEMALSGGDAAAVWLAREISRAPKEVSSDSLRIVALYIWFSAHPTTVAGGLIARPWLPELRFATARNHARTWLERLSLRAHIGGGSIGDVWLTPATIDGFMFVPLATEAAITAEAEAMQNCLRSYGHCLRSDRTRLWSIRTGDQRVATVAVSRWRGGPMLQITQLRGQRNAQGATDAWTAAYKWLRTHDLAALMARPLQKNVPLDRATWIELWRPYWLGVRRIPHWLPLAPSTCALDDL